MYELTDKHGNILCFDGQSLVGIKCKWRNILKTLIAESFNKSLKENTDNWCKESISAATLTYDDILEITENDNVYFYSSVHYNGLGN